MKDLLTWVRTNLIKERPEMFMKGDTVLVIICFKWLFEIKFVSQFSRQNKSQNKIVVNNERKYYFTRVINGEHENYFL